MPIAGARVTAIADRQTSGPSAITDQRGAFRLALAPGAYTVTFAANGFAEQSLRVTALAGQVTRDVALEIDRFVATIWMNRI
jgi:hypothetical protein